MKRALNRLPLRGMSRRTRVRLALVEVAAGAAVVGLLVALYGAAVVEVLAVAVAILVLYAGMYSERRSGSRAEVLDREPPDLFAP